MSIHVCSLLTHIDNKEDVPYLRSKLLDVNIRLMRCSEDYWKLVYEACKHVEKACLERFDGYKLPHGMSGANLGIPWNIIGRAINRGMEDASCRVMLNPRITFASTEMDETTTNCGSIRLPKSIKVLRHRKIVVEWYDLDCKRHLTDHYPDTGSYTIQHEIDHNLGVLITDKEVSSANKPIKDKAS